MGEISYRLYTEKDKQEIIDLTELVYPNRNYNTNFFEWQYERSPLGKANIFIAECDEKVVGVETFVAHRLYCNGEEIPVWRSQDSIIHPDYRMRGIFSSLMKYAHASEVWEENAFQIGFPNEKSLRSLEIVGYHVHSKIVDYEIRIPHSYKNYSCQFKFQMDFNFLNEDLLELFRKNDGTYLSLYKSKEFLTWRYLQSPLSKYYIVSVERFGSVLGYMILKQYLNNTVGLRYLHIVDIKVANEDECALKELVCHAVDLMQTEKCHVVNMFASSPNAKKVLEELNFKSETIDRYIMVYYNNKTAEEMSRQLMFNMADNDIY